MEPIKELEFCLKLWSKKGYCGFGNYTKCEQCASPYILYKLITGEALHEPGMQRLSLQDWKNKLDEILSLPQPGQKFRHFKGGVYEVLEVALNSDNPNQKVVVYKSLENGQTWVREINGFVGFKEFSDDSKVKRFELLG